MLLAHCDGGDVVVVVARAAAVWPGSRAIGAICGVWSCSGTCGGGRSRAAMESCDSCESIVATKKQHAQRWWKEYRDSNATVIGRRVSLVGLVGLAGLVKLVGYRLVAVRVGGLCGLCGLCVDTDVGRPRGGWGSGRHYPFHFPFPWRRETR